MGKKFGAYGAIYVERAEQDLIHVSASNPVAQAGPRGRRFHILLPHRAASFTSGNSDMSHRRCGRSDRPSRPIPQGRSIEMLEPRTLFSAADQALAAAGFAAMQWNGQQAYAKAGEWILHVDGITGKRSNQLDA